MDDLPLPWAGDRDGFLHRARTTVDGASVLLAMVRGPQPRPDHLLAVDGIDEHTLTAWCSGGGASDASFAAAQVQGCVAAQTNGHAEGLMPPGHTSAVVAVPACLETARWWLMVVGRRGDAFSGDELKRVNLILRKIQVAFDGDCGHNVGRVLLGDDFRVVHADPRTEAIFSADPAVERALVETLPAVVAQRWPGLDDLEPHDVTLDLAGWRVWLRFRNRGPAGRFDPAAGWSVEVRELDDDAMPTIGVVEDDRVARVLGYLTDHYAETQRLEAVAERESVSPFHFHRLFSKQAGLSPKQFVLRTQLMIAKWRLRSSRTPISDIAADAGFASHGHFTATFTRMVGKTPSDYRDG